MPPAAALTELDSRATCHACGRALAPGSAVCTACGAAHGETNRCPHCGAIADVEPHAALGFRCLVCGGPRLALNVSGVVPSAPTVSALRSAGKSQTEHVMYSSAGFVLVGMGMLALLIASLVVLTASPGLVPTLAAYLGALVPTAAGLAAFVRAANIRKHRAQALHAAEVSALGDVQAVTGPLDAQRVTEILRVAPERAELLLAEASVAALLDPVPAPRVRVAASPTVLSTAADADEAASELGEPRGRTVHGDPEN